MDSSKLDACFDEWQELEKDFDALTKNHEKYSEKVVEVKNIQKQCQAGLNHQTYRLKAISEQLKKLSKTETGIDLHKVKLLQRKITDRKLQFRDIKESLPHKNGLYLSVILGQVNVSLLSKEDRFAYKQDYERFKLVMTCILLVFSVLLLTVINHRWSDATFHFLSVWYYCTMTIREHILINNGSRIKGWWITHHFISTFCAGLFLIWPDGESYRSFRTQMTFFSFVLFIVNLLQSFYQQGQLYRLRALGERHTMDITVEGFHSWMFKGLTFLLPALYMIYFFQLYNAYTLFLLARSPTCHEWHVPLLSFCFLVLFSGNFSTSLLVIRQKFKRKEKVKHTKEIKRKYSFGNVLYKADEEDSNNGNNKNK